MKPLVSVIIAVRDGEKWIEESIKSVHAQTYQPIELIVVDDGSIDQSVQIARRLGVRVIQRPARGQPSALNTGLEVSTGAYIGFLDADDKYPTGRVQSMMTVLLERLDIEGVFGFVEEFAEKEVGTVRDARPPAALRLPGSMIMRRTLLDRVGSFDETYELTSVAAWIAVAQGRGARLVGIDEVVLLRRLHTSNIGLSGWSHRSEYARAMHAGLVARRNPKDKAGP